MKETFEVEGKVVGYNVSDNCTLITDQEIITETLADISEGNLQQYIGTKVINAEPAIKDGMSGYRVVYLDGYESWSPADVFEEAYRPMRMMTFGMAIEAAKKGLKIAREGWNGKGMFVVYQKGYPDGIPCNKNTAEAFGYQEGELFKCRPYLQMRCADGTHQMWLASQSDILEEDWYIVE